MSPGGDTGHVYPTFYRSIGFAAPPLIIKFSICKYIQWYHIDPMVEIGHRAVPNATRTMLG